MSVYTGCHDISIVIIILIMFFTDMVLTDEEFRRLKQRDPQIIKKIYLAYRKDIYNFLLIKCRGDNHLASDILSATILSAIEAAAGLTSKERLHSWLLKIAHRRYVDYIRQAVKEKKQLDAVKAEKLTAAAEDIHDNLELKHKVLLLNSTLAQLKPEYRQVLQLKVFEEKKNPEIARLLGKNEKAVENLYCRAKKALKAGMKLTARNLKG